MTCKLCPCMQFREAGQEWDHIDQTTLEEVETSWAHSRCREVVFDITDSEVSVCSLCLFNTTLHHITLHHTTPHHSALHHTTPHHTTPHYTTPHHTTPHYTTSHYVTPHYTTPHHTTSHHTTLHHTTLRHTTPHHTMPHYSTLHYHCTQHHTLHLLQLLYIYWCSSIYLLKVHRGSTVSLDGLHGNTLDATMKLLCAAVRGIIQRKDHFVVKLQVNHEQVSSLGKMKQIARSKCAVTVSRRELDSKTVTVLELKPR